MNRLKASFAAVGVAAVACTAAAQARPLMIVGLDEKHLWDDEGKTVLSPPGRDSLAIIDLADPESPKIVATLPLKNSVVGPPVNLAITPDGALALVADSVDVVKDGEALKIAPDTTLHVIDLRATPPKLLDSVTVGKQPSGLSISSDGRTALVANRADNSITVLSIDGTSVKVADTVPMNDSVAHVAFTPDGRRALAVKFTTHKVSLLSIADGKVTYDKLDLPTGQWPYNVSVAPNGKYALVADNGASGASDGSVDTVSVVDLEADPPRISDRVVVGDGPEGLDISPKGDWAATALLRGGNSSKKAYFYNATGSLVALKVTGKSVVKAGEIPVGGLPETVCFTPDGRYLYVGNYLDGDISILKVTDAGISDTGKRFKVPGHPASARMSPN